LTFWATYYIVIMGYKIIGGEYVPKKVGRPTDNPKGKSIHVRLDKKSEEILEKYCNEFQVNRAESIRRGIGKLESDLKNK